MIQLIPNHPNPPVKLTRRVIDRMAMGQSPVHVILDAKDLQSSRDFDGKRALMLSHYRKWPLDAPEYIKEIVRNPDFRFLVWISRRVCESSEAEFCLTLAHELQHVRLASNDPQTYKLGLLLLDKAHEWYPDIPSWVRIPVEYDAERTGKGVVLEFLGQSAFDSLIASKLESCALEDKPRWEDLRDLPFGVPFDVAHETRRWVCRYKEKYKRLRREDPEVPFIEEFDFDEICS